MMGKGFRPIFIFILLFLNDNFCARIERIIDVLGSCQKFGWSTKELQLCDQATIILAAEGKKVYLNHSFIN